MKEEREEDRHGGEMKAQGLKAEITATDRSVLQA